jgi:ADP-ribose pyrophosphatase YjhB (NUDIX family)
VYLTEAMLEAAARRWGEPRRHALTFEITPRERGVIHGTSQPDRVHDITLFIERDAHFAVIAKPFFPPGVWRAPSGGLVPGEDLEAGAKREALEETGLEIELARYLLRIDARFTLGLEVEPWHTHVFLARAAAGELAPRDTREIRAARWAAREELQGPIRAALLATGFPLFRYRVALTDAAFERIDELARAR